MAIRINQSLLDDTERLQTPSMLQNLERLLLYVTLFNMLKLGHYALLFLFSRDMHEIDNFMTGLASLSWFSSLKKTDEIKTTIQFLTNRLEDSSNVFQVFLPIYFTSRQPHNVFDLQIAALVDLQSLTVKLGHEIERISARGNQQQRKVEEEFLAVKQRLEVSSRRDEKAW
jgi:hypothetical protein